MKWEETESRAPDIYFDKNYGKLYEKMEHGMLRIFVHKSEYGQVSSQFIMREIPASINGTQYYDLATPYGYGGPIILECNGNKEKLIKGFEKEFEDYCLEHNIVSEFIRFHPIMGNALDFKEMYEVTWDRHTAGTNLELAENPVLAEFSKSCRKNIRQAFHKGITYRITKAPDNLHNFKEIYYSTMKRNEAEAFYYFDDSYFEQCIALYREHILLVEAVYGGKVIAAGFYFVWRDMIHIHLSGTLSEYLYLSPAYILRYAVTVWGKEHGYRFIHHGGGTGRGDDNSLYRFKKQFGKNTELDFYIGKKIWNRKVYGQLCNMAGDSKNTGYFPAYRNR